MHADLLRSGANGVLRIADWAGVLRRFSSAETPSVLMYHGIVREKASRIGLKATDLRGFRRQMTFLKKHFSVIPAEELGERAPIRSRSAKPAVVLTFDDGFASNATLAWPVLEQMRLPAVFFVTTRHIAPGRYLWFIHARALFALWPERELELLGSRWRLRSPAARQQVLAAFMQECRTVPIGRIYEDLSHYPVEQFAPPEVVESEMRGMNQGELAKLSRNPLATVGGHTRNHPFLTECGNIELDTEIAGAKAELERVCKRPVTMFAYPAGDYNHAVIEAVKNAGFTLAFAVQPSLVAGGMTIPRTGVYRAGLGVFAAKAYQVFSRQSAPKEVSTRQCSPAAQPGE